MTEYDIGNISNELQNILKNILVQVFFAQVMFKIKENKDRKYIN